MIWCRMDITFRLQSREIIMSIPNYREVALAMGDEIKHELLRRLRFGAGARGQLPHPKSGGKPYNATGTLVRSIAVVERVSRSQPEVGRDGTPYAVVRATGDRPPRENAKGKVARAKERTKQARAAAAIGFALQESVGGVVPEHFIRKTPDKSGNRYKLSRIRVRAADTNAALAAILSQPPKDARGIKGKRGIYRVFEVNDTYRRLAFNAARATMKIDVRLGGIAA